MTFGERRREIRTSRKGIQKGESMNENIHRSNPPTVCGVLSCMGDAYVTIYTGNGELIGICPDCLDELNRLQTGATLPEQRAGVILHYHNVSPGLRFTASIEAGEESEGQE